MRYRAEKNEKNTKDQVGKYKHDFLKYFEMKLTKQGAAVDLDGTGTGNNANKIPKRKKTNAKNSVADIAENVQSLINFGKKQSDKMKDLKKITIKPEKL